MNEAYEQRAFERRRTMSGRLARSRAEVTAIELERDASPTPNERAEAIWGSRAAWRLKEPMHLNSDLIDLLQALNAEGAEYLIVGGYAALR